MGNFSLEFGHPEIDERITTDACVVLLALLYKCAALMVHGRAKVYGGDGVGQIKKDDDDKY